MLADRHSTRGIVLRYMNRPGGERTGIFSDNIMIINMVQHSHSHNEVIWVEPPQFSWLEP